MRYAGKGALSVSCGPERLFTGCQKKHSIFILLSFYPALKDAVEAIGVPHVEVAAILVNGLPALFLHRLQPNDTVEIFPEEHRLLLPVDYKLRNKTPHRFVLDVHLGSLARTLRLLGFDALYENDYADKDIVALAANESRVVLTRDIGLLKHRSVEWGYWLRSQQTNVQVQEVI